MKYFLVLFLAFGSLCKADAQWRGIDIQPRDMAFISGYLSACAYDLSVNKTPQPNSHSVGWKITLGIIAGTAIALCDANINNSAIPFGDIILGGIGGLTCAVIHF